MAEINWELPLPPWTHEALGEELYCRIATELGYFNPKNEQSSYRPDLDPTPHLDIIRMQQSMKKTKRDNAAQGGNQ